MSRLDFFLYHGFKYISLCKRLKYDYKRAIGEIKADLHKYDDSGAIDTSSVYRWAEIA